MLLLLYILLAVKAQEEYGSLLLYEDQKDIRIDDVGKNMNFLTPRRKIHEKEKKFTEICAYLKMLGSEHCKNRLILWTLTKSTLQNVTWLPIVAVHTPENEPSEVSGAG